MSVENVLDLSDEEYVAAFRSFKAATNERDLITSWFERSIAGGVSGSESIGILSVGGGDGELDIRIIRSIIEKCEAIHYHAIEPSSPALSAFKEKVEALGSSRLHFSADQAGFESYRSNKNFDLVHFIHSLMYIQNPLRQLLRALEMSRGSVIIVNQTLKGISELRQEFLPLIRGSGPETLTSEDIRETLLGAGCQFHEEVLEASVDVTPCFEPDSKEGMLLMSFFLLCRIDKLDRETREKALSRLRKMISSESSRRILPMPVAAFTIRNKGSNK